MDLKPVLKVSSITSYIDDDVHISVTGGPANHKVTIRAKMSDEDGKLFESYGVFKTDREGSVNVSTEKPVEGSYEEADASGLFWSMKLAGSKRGDFFIKRKATPVSIKLILEVDGQVVDMTTLQRYFYNDDNISKETVDSAGVTGVLFYPSRKESCPGILLLGGSDGGVDEYAAALLASHGYAVLALAYFGIKDVPKNLENIPLEYFQEATTWLNRHPRTNGQVAIIGFSRGGELALLLASTFDEYQAVVAAAPGAYVTAGMRNGIFAPIPSWTLKNEALDYMKFSYRPTTILSMLWKWLLKRPVSYLSIWDHTLRDPKKVDKVRIQVEKIQAPVLTIAGEDDQIWPSVYYSQKVEETRSAAQLPYEAAHYKEAGHFLSFPYNIPNLPANVLMKVGGMTMTFGGTKAANAKAARESKVRVLTFLEQSMKSSVDEQRKA